MPSSKDKKFLERMRASDKVRKLMATANRHPDTPEGKSALRVAGNLIAKYKLDAESLKPKPEVSKRPVHTADPFATFGGAIKQNYRGKDTTDYTKFDPETGKVRQDDYS